MCAVTGVLGGVDNPYRSFPSATHAGPFHPAGRKGNGTFTYELRKVE